MKVAIYGRKINKQSSAFFLDVFKQFNDFGWKIHELETNTLIFLSSETQPKWLATFTEYSMLLSGAAQGCWQSLQLKNVLGDHSIDLKPPRIKGLN